MRFPKSRRKPSPLCYRGGKVLPRFGYQLSSVGLRGTGGSVGSVASVGSVLSIGSVGSVGWVGSRGQHAIPQTKEETFPPLLQRGESASLVWIPAFVGSVGSGRSVRSVESARSVRLSKILEMAGPVGGGAQAVFRTP